MGVTRALLRSMLMHYVTATARYLANGEKAAAPAN
jgi:hypothetical protein